MTNPELAVLFDLVKQHADIIDFGRVPEKSPGYDLYPTRPNVVHQKAFAMLAAAGLAQVRLWSGLTCYQLDETARVALGV